MTPILVVMAGWGGRKVQRIRSQLAGMLPVECSHCGRLVTEDDEWDVDHVVPQAVDPGRAWDMGNLWPAHARCNRAAGGRSRRRRGAFRGAEAPRLSPSVSPPSGPESRTKINFVRDVGTIYQDQQRGGVS